MDAEGTAAGAPRAEPDRVLLVLEPGRDRELLSEWLGSFPAYEVAAVAPTDSLPEYDLCVLHEHGLERTRATLTDRKADADPVHLPHLLLRPGDGQAGPVSDDPAVDWTLVDDVMGLPVDQSALKRRVENLLQARRASLRLREREDQYQQLVELTPEGIVIVEDGVVLYANTAAVDLLRLHASEEIEGERLSSYVLDEDEQALADTLAAVVDDGQSSTYTELELVTSAGTTVPTSVAGVQVTYEGRPVTQLVVRDLSEQKARQQRLDLFGRAIESAAEGITIADAQQDDDPLIYANDAFERITGYGRGAVLGRNCRFLQGANTDESTVAEIRAALAEERPVSVELLNYREDGVPFWNALDIVPVRGESGEVTHYLGLQRDVTERKEREQRVAVLDRVLRHNLRNRTNVIRGYAELIGEVPDERVREEILDAADELLGISEQVRAFRSVVSEEDQDSISALDIVPVIRDAAEGFRESHPDGEITVEAPESVSVQADHTLPAAVRDLVEMAGQSAAPSVGITVETTDEEVLVELVDRGDAFDHDDLRVLGGDLETPLEHLQGIDLWLVRWSVEHSGGEFETDTDGDHPAIRMRLLPA